MYQNLVLYLARALSATLQVFESGIPTVQILSARSHQSSPEAQLAHFSPFMDEAKYIRRTGCKLQQPATSRASASDAESLPPWRISVLT